MNLSVVVSGTKILSLLCTEKNYKSNNLRPVFQKEPINLELMVWVGVNNI